jgi:hypothetical protein
MALDDIMLFDFAKSEWVAVLQMGIQPEGRWSCALSYNEEKQRLFVFGGG